MAANKTTARMANYLGNNISGQPYGYPNYGYPNYNPNYATKRRVTTYETPWGFNTSLSDTDTMYNIGAALGTLWGANYNQRGAAKASQEAQDILDKYTQAAVGQPNTDQQQQRQAINDSLYQQAEKAGLTQNYQQVKPDVNGNMTMAQPQYDPKAIRQQFIAQKYPDGGDPNPVTTAKTAEKDIAEANNLMSGTDLNALMSKGFNAAQLKTEVINELRKRGRNDWQIQQAMNDIAPTLDAKEQEFRTGTFNQLYDQYKTLIAANRFDDASMIYAKMKQINPDYAAAASNQYNRAYKDWEQERQLERKADLIVKYRGVDKATAMQLALGSSLGSRVSGKGGSGGKGGSVIADSNIGYDADGEAYISLSPKNTASYLKVTDALEKKYGDTPFDKWSESDKAKYKWHEEAYWASMYGGKIRPYGYTTKKQRESQKEAAMNNEYGDYGIPSSIRDNLRKQHPDWTWAQIAEQLKEEIPDNYYYKESVIQEALNNQAAAEKEAADKAETRRKYSKKTFFGTPIDELGKGRTVEIEEDQKDDNYIPD